MGKIMDDSITLEESDKIYLIRSTKERLKINISNY